MSSRRMSTRWLLTGLVTLISLGVVLPAAAQTPLRIGGSTFPNAEEFVKQGRRCATPVLSGAQRTNINQRVRQFAEANAGPLAASTEAVTIPVFFHVVHNGDDGMVTEDRLDEQLQVLNDAFMTHRIRFVKVGTDFTDNSEWFTMDLDTAAEAAAKAALNADPKRNLNFYTCQPPGGTLGWARFPWELATAPELDGVVVLHSSVPGGDAAPFNLGDTAVHEVGHWLGLFHTFGENPFDPCIDTDEITDTPAHHVNFNKPPDSTDTCEAAGNDPVHNYMNYVDDDWMDHFTAEQVERLHLQIGLYRPLLLSGELRIQLSPLAH